MTENLQNILTHFPILSGLTTNQILVLAGLIVGALLALFAYRIFGILITIVHEFGHAFVAKLTLGKVYKITLNRDTSGLTETSAGWRSLLVLLAGYPFPILLSGFFALLLNRQHPELAVLSFLLINLLVLIVVKNLYGILICLVSVLASGLILYFAQTGCLYALTGLLISSLTLAGLRDFFIIFHKNVAPSDADLLHQRFRIIPTFLWKMLLSILLILSTGLLTKVLIEFFQI